jgi:hypothetical protein
LTSAAGGRQTVEVEAGTIRQLLIALECEVPSPSEHLEQSVAVPIDGEMFRASWSQKVLLVA